MNLRILWFLVVVALPHAIKPQLVKNEGHYVISHLQSIASVSGKIRDSVPSWVNYSFNHNNIIVDTFSIQRGYQVRAGSVKAGSSLTHLTFHRFYGFTNYDIASSRSLPLFALMWIKDEDQSTNQIYQFQSTARTGTSRITNGTSTRGSYTAKYIAVTNLSGLSEHGTPALFTQLFFNIENKKLWGSRSPDSTEHEFQMSTMIEPLPPLYNYTLLGSPANMLIGYMYLASALDSVISDENIAAVMDSILIGLSLDDEVLVHLRSIVAVSDQLRAAVPAWTNYTFNADGAPNPTDINRGNQVEVSVGNMRTPIIFNRFYRFDHYDVTSSISYPFVALVWINRENQNPDQSYEIKVLATHGEIRMTNGTSIRGSYIARYNAVTSPFGQNKVSPPARFTQLFFIVENQKYWRSRPPSSTAHDYTRRGPAPPLHTFTVTGKPENILIGYTYLASGLDSGVSDKNISSVVDNILLGLILEEISQRATTTTTTTFTEAPAIESICPPVTVPGIGPNKSDISFDFARLYDVAPSVQVCNVTGRPIATMQCAPRKPAIPNYDVATLKVLDCNYTLEYLAGVISHPNKIDSLSDVTSMLEVLTSSPSSLSVGDVMTATEIVVNISEVPVDETVSVEVVENIIQTVNHLAITVNMYEAEGMFVDENHGNVATLTKSTLQLSLKNLIERVQFVGNTTSVALYSADMAVQALQISNGSAYDDVIFHVTSGENGIVVTIPSQAVGKIMEENYDDLLFHATLLRDGSLLDSTANISEIVSVGARNVSSTNTPISIVFGSVVIPDDVTQTENKLKVSLNKAEIVHWVETELQWVRGSCYRGDLRNSNPEYYCNDFASFAILFSSRIIPSNVVLSVVSYIGCAISIVSLLATITIYLYFRELREKPSAQTLINVCICLTLVYLLYAVGVGLTPHHTTCDAMTVILHYTTLCCWGWLCINAYEMRQAFTKPFQGYAVANTVAKYSFAYGLPMLIVLINSTVTLLYLDKLENETDIFFESLYRAKFVCWLNQPSFYWGFCLPLALALLFNLVIFALLINKITCQKKKIRSSAKPRTLKNRLINSIVLTTTLGLTWIFGYFLLIADDVVYQSVMQWLFTVFNVLQGLVIFLMRCVRPQSVRKLWLPCCKCT